MTKEIWNNLTNNYQVLDRIEKVKQFLEAARSLNNDDSHISSLITEMYQIEYFIDREIPEYLDRQEDEH